MNQLILTNTSICTDNKHGKIRTVAGKAKDGGLQVLVVTCQIDERDHFRGTLTDLLCRSGLAVIDNLEEGGITQDHSNCDKSAFLLLLYRPRWIYSHLSFTVETKDLEADAWCAPSLDFMQVSEEIEPRSSSAIIQLTLCQNTQQSGLARVHITQDSHSQVQELVGRGRQHRSR